MAEQLQCRDPRKVGPYWLLGRLGGGGMGQVFLGRSPGGRLVAVKVVRAELAEQAEFRNRFAREVVAAQKVSGLFTAPVVDADVDAAVPWLATAYVPGLSLAEAITRHGPLPAESVLALAAGLAEGLGAIHAAGIVHRDLKPSNVLLAEDGPRIIDFGISWVAEATALTGTGLVVGSPTFMSPEQARGHRVGPPSDVFSLGAVLTIAATGQGPFGTGSSGALLYRVVFTPPDTSGLPAKLRPLVERCLAKDPEQRPSTDRLLAELNTAAPAAGWLPAPITQALPSHPSSESSPAAPTTVDDLSAMPVTQSAAHRAGVPDSKMPTGTSEDMLPLAAAEAPGNNRGERRPGRLRLGLAATAAAVALIIIYLIVAVTAHLSPFGEVTIVPSSSAPVTTAPASTGPRPSPVVTSAAASPATSPATSPTAPAASTTSPAASTTSPAVSPTSPTTSPTAPATSPTAPATPPTAPATSPTAPATPPTAPATSPAASPAASATGLGLQ